MTAKVWVSKEEEREKCEEKKSVKDIESSLGEEEKDDKTTCSFLHAVINMVGMLIGELLICSLNTLLSF